MRPQLVISLNGLANSCLYQGKRKAQQLNSSLRMPFILSTTAFFPGISLVDHTNAAVLGIEKLNVFFAAVGNTPIRMMGQPFFSFL